jgi:hypothetical protein
VKEDDVNETMLNPVNELRRIAADARTPARDKIRALEVLARLEPPSAGNVVRIVLVSNDILKRVAQELGGNVVTTDREGAETDPATGLPRVLAEFTDEATRQSHLYRSVPSSA